MEDSLHVRMWIHALSPESRVSVPIIGNSPILDCLTKQNRTKQKPKETKNKDCLSLHLLISFGVKIKASLVGNEATDGSVLPTSMISFPSTLHMPMATSLGDTGVSMRLTELVSSENPAQLQVPMNGLWSLFKTQD